MTVALDSSAVASEPYCSLTTIGRSSGKPHEIEIWFTMVAGMLMLISGGGPNADWVKNLVAEPVARVRIGDVRLAVRATLQPTDPDVRLTAATGLAEKYAGQFDDAGSWVDAAFLVALDPQSDVGIDPSL